MFYRFDVRPVIRGHWKALTLSNRSPSVPDWTARITLVLPALSVMVVSILRDWKLAAPAALLGGVALLAGGTLSAFTHLSTLRLRLTDRIEEQSLDVERDSLDESVAHLLTATLLCIVDAAALVIGMNFASPNGTSIGGLWASLVLGVSTYIATLFVLLVPKLYSAYVDINRVGGHISGFDRSWPRG